MGDRRENPLDQIEVAAFGLILQRLIVRGRLALELDLKELEHEVGRELPEVRTQLNGLIDVNTQGLPGYQQLTAEPPGQPLRSTDLAHNKVPRKGPGRPPRQLNSQHGPDSNDEPFRS